MKFLSIYFLACIIIITACGVSHVDHEFVKAELEQVKEKYINCTNELNEYKNTAESRLFKAQKSFEEKDLLAARQEYLGIITYHPGSKESIIAKDEIDKIDRLIEANIIEESKKKNLGFKGLKQLDKVKFDNIEVSIENVYQSKTWAFDDYGSTYSYIEAERGNKHILAKVKITSEDKDPLLPPILVYELVDGKANLLGAMSYRFRRWEDYGSYLGNHADYGNDFARTKSIPFNLGIELSSEVMEKKIIFVVIHKTGCYTRFKSYLSNPPIQYNESTCMYKKSLQLSDFDNEYVLIKVFNKDMI